MRQVAWKPLKNGAAKARHRFDDIGARKLTFLKHNKRGVTASLKPSPAFKISRG